MYKAQKEKLTCSRRQDGDIQTQHPDQKQIFICIHKQNFTYELEMNLQTKKNKLYYHNTRKDIQTK